MEEIEIYIVIGTTTYDLFKLVKGFKSKEEAEKLASKLNETKEADDEFYYETMKVKMEEIED